MRILIAAAVAVTLSTAALAQTTEFYVVQDVKTKRCTIVEKRPATTTEVPVLGTTVFKTRAEAESGFERKRSALLTSQANAPAIGGAMSRGAPRPPPIPRGSV